MRFTLATAEHDAALRRLQRAQPMPGRIRLAFASEPSWTAAHAVLGDVSQTLVATDATGAVTGCGVRTIRRRYVNGSPTELGYLSGLRSLPRVRGALGLAQGFRFLRQLHESDRRTPAYLTTIIEGNETAEVALTSARAGLPAYVDHGRFITSAVFLSRPRKPAPPAGGVEIRTGAEIAWPAILDFLRMEGPRRQFFPVVDASDFDTPLWRDLRPADFRVALRGGAIVGVAAAWDQSAYRQTVVTGYDPLLRLLRPLANLGVATLGRPALPPPGSQLRFFHLALPCVRGDDVGVFAAMLERFHADWKDGTHACFVVGLHERDPLRAALASFPTFDYASRLHVAAWEDGAAFVAGLDPHRIPHLETALL